MMFNWLSLITGIFYIVLGVFVIIYKFFVIFQGFESLAGYEEA